MEKRTVEGERRHELGKKLYYEKNQKEKIEHEIQNGLELLGKHIRLSDFIKEKILHGKTQVLVMNGERKKQTMVTGLTLLKKQGVYYIYTEKNTSKSLG